MAVSTAFEAAGRGRGSFYPSCRWNRAGKERVRGFCGFASTFPADTGGQPAGRSIWMMTGSAKENWMICTGAGVQRNN